MSVITTTDGSRNTTIEPDVNDAPSLSVPVLNCARCGENHENIVFLRFARPILKEDGEIDVTHWGMCPTNQEPILLWQIKAKRSEGEER